MTIRKIIEGILNGQIRIPAFQREFVWEPERVALFIDSIYKQYPFGSLLFWRAGELLNHEKQLGPYALPELQDDYPIDYVLDGQQRVTSIFASFQTELQRPAEDEWADIYFDYRTTVDPQDSSFFALPAAEADPAQFFPVRVLFDSAAYRKATEGVDENLVNVIDELQTRIKEALVPVELLRTDDQAKVAIVFERINHQGVPLDTLQLLTAWTWSDDFDLQQRFEDLREALEEHGFAGVGEDTSLVLRCCAAILVQQPTSDHLIQLNGSEVRDNFERIENGIKGAIDFLRVQLGVETLRNMPYPAMLIPLSAYFASDGSEQIVLPDADRKTLQRWFWRSCFSERYSGQTNRVARNDIAEMVKLRSGEANNLGDFGVEIGPEFFRDTVFRLGSARSATFVLLLASRKPRSFISGNLVDLEGVLQAYNRHEFHHMYPRKMLRDIGLEPAEVNCLANMCILSRADNNEIKASPPSVYKGLMPDGASLDAIVESSVATSTLFSDDFYAFRDERADALAAIARELIA